MQTTQGADKAARPVALAVEPGGIPEELKQLKRWVGWRYYLNRAGATPLWQKEPVNPKTGWAASSKKKATWGTFAEAVGAYESGRGKLDGIGLMLSSGPGDPFDLLAIDLDVPGLEALLAPLGTYCERSPTEGKGGAHAYVWGTLPEGAKSRPREVELYTWGRYMAVTGDRLDGAAAAVARPDPGTLAAVLAALGVLAEPAPPPPAPPQTTMCPPRPLCPPCPPVPPTHDDDFLLGRAFAATNGAAIKALWEGSTAGHRSASEADLALCRHLAFYWRGDEAAVDRMFRRSKLFREGKWDRPAGAGGETYRAKTVRKAVASCKGVFYTGAGPNGSAPPAKGDTGDRGDKRDGGDTLLFAAGPGAGGPASANGHAPPQGVPGVSAAALVAEDVQLFWAPWVPAGVLTLVAGDPETGKSTFLAFLAAHARSVLLVPGAEEGLGRMVVPRLAAHGCDLSRVHVLNDRPYSLPSDRDSLLRYARDLRADLLLVDPVDAVFPEGYSDNDPIPVRSFLESLAFVAERTGAAVVGVRHPGKAPGNVMPGSRQWRAVPRVILQMQRDKGPPERRVLRPWKYSVGPWPSPIYFDLPAAGKRPVFRPGAPVDPQTAQLFDDEPRRLERGKVVQARLLLRRLLKDGRMEAAMVLGICGKNGLPDTPVYTAKDLDGVVSKREGFGLGSKVYWVPPDVWPAVDEDDDEEEGET